MYIWFWRKFNQYRNLKWFYLTGWAICMQTIVKNLRRRNPMWMNKRTFVAGIKCLWYAVNM